MELSTDFEKYANKWCFEMTVEEESGLRLNYVGGCENE